MMKKYYRNTKDGIELKDKAILKAIDEAKSLYEDGAIIEAAEIFEWIIEAIRFFDT